MGSSNHYLESSIRKLDTPQLTRGELTLANIYHHVFEACSGASRRVWPPHRAEAATLQPRYVMSNTESLTQSSSTLHSLTVASPPVLNTFSSPNQATPLTPSL